MSKFNTRLVFYDDGGLPYTLAKPLIYESDLLKETISVPEGFQTDLASIPRGLWNILPKSGGYDAGGVIHDYLYKYNGMTRKQADQVLVEACEVNGVGWKTCKVIYWGVRMGGWVPWGNYRKSDGAPQS